MIALIDAHDAVKHLNLDVYDAALLNQKILEASAAVMKHMKLEEMPEAWADDPDASPLVYTVPFDIQCSTFFLLGELWQNRESGTYDPSEKWKTFLVGYRDPTLA